jgi:quinoprotein glucose dehydrogenase
MYFSRAPGFQSIHFSILFLAVFSFFMFSGCRNDADTWAVYKADAESSSYSPLSSINRANIRQLKPAWSFTPNDAADSNRFGRSQSNPIVADGVLYSTSARHRLYAIDAASGKLIWSFDPFNGGPGGGAYRGVSFWQEGEDKRILFTAGDELFAVNANNGKLIVDFGDSGRVSMNVGIRDDPHKISIRPTTPGTIYRDLIIIGNEVSELYGAQPGYIRAYSVKTGKLIWTFHTIPKPGEIGYNTWPKDAWKYAGGANCWGGMSLDEKRGIVFLSTGSPTYDFYGADREGMNLFGNSVVALEAATGRYIWHFQTIHHDLWDYDLPAPPNLVTVTHGGKKIDAVAQTSKIGFLYLLDRETGKPLFPVEEKPVPLSDIPGEHAWPTQPVPVKPAPFAVQSVTENDIAFYNQASYDSMVKQFRSWRYEGLFTPPSLKGTLMAPGTIGGAEWGGGAYDKETGIIYIKSNHAPEVNQLTVVNNSTTSDVNQGYERGREIYNTYCASCHKPDRKGGEPYYPSLVGIEKKLSEKAVIDKIKKGGGKMPPFESVIKGQEKSIIAFLFQQRDRKAARSSAELKEIRQNLAAQGHTADTSQQSTTYLNLSAYSLLKSPEGYPFFKGPWGVLHAIDLNSGEYVWSVPVGNHPDLQKGEARTGAESTAGPIVTAGGLIFSSGSADKTLQCFDKSNGKLIWETKLPATGTSTPSMYRVKGKDFLVLSVAGDSSHPGGYIMAFALEK